MYATKIEIENCLDKIFTEQPKIENQNTPGCVLCKYPQMQSLALAHESTTTR